VAVDAEGNVYVSEYRGHRIRRFGVDGSVTTVAGTGTAGFSGDGGPATGAALRNPFSMDLDGAGNLYFVDQGNARIRRVSADGTITTIAGNGTAGYTGDGGAATDARISAGRGLVVDAAGTVYFSGSDRIRRVSGGAIETVVGNGTYGFAVDGAAALSSPLREPGGLALDAEGNLVFAETSGFRIRRVTPSGLIATLAGSGTFGYDGDGLPAFRASLGFPIAVTTDSSGNLFFFDDFAARIRRVNTRGLIQTVAGDGRYGRVPDGTPALEAYFFSPRGMAFDGQGNLIVANFGVDRVSMVTRAGEHREVAGLSSGCCNDGRPAREALLSGPLGVAVDSEGQIYISQIGFDRVRRIGKDGIITTFAGTGAAGFSGDGGLATSAMLADPGGLAFDRSGNLYIADNTNRRIRRVTPAGVIETFAGDGQNRFFGDGGPARAGSFRTPFGLAFLPNGDLLVADFSDNRVRRIDGSGTMHTFAGNGQAASSGDGGPATEASLHAPTGVAVDAEGVAYVLERDSNRIRRIGPNGVITTVAGSGQRGFAGDGGPSLAARLNSPILGIAVSAEGNVVFADTVNNRLRVFRREEPGFRADPGSLTLTVGAGGTSEPVALTVQSDLPGLPFTVEVKTSDGRRWLFAIPDKASAPQVIQVFADASELAPGSYEASIEMQAPGASPSTISIPVTVRVQ
jgi:sugar lactone lactonase YvrE